MQEKDASYLFKSAKGPVYLIKYNFIAGLSVAQLVATDIIAGHLAPQLLVTDIIAGHTDTTAGHWHNCICHHSISTSHNTVINIM